MAKADQRSELATKLAAVLRERRDAGDYPTAVAKLRVSVEGEFGDETWVKALKDKALLVAANDDPASPIALAEDAESMARSDALLRYALGQLASADKPLHPVARIVGKVNKALRDDFEAALNHRIEGGTLPPGVGRRDVKDAPHLYLEQFPPPQPKVSPARQLAERMAEAMRARREAGERIVALSALYDAETPGAMVKKALTEEAFDAVSVPVSKSLTLVCVAEDSAALYASDRLLTALLEANTSAKRPLATAEAIAEALPEEHREPFLTALEDRISRKSYPAGVLARDASGEVSFGLERHLPATKLLGEQVVAGLERRRESGHDYPVALQKLLAEDAPEAPAELVEQLVSDKAFNSQVTLASPGRADAPAVLVGDEERLASSPVLLTYAVGLLSTPEDPLHPLKKVVARLAPALRPAFEAAVTKHISESALPDAVAAHEVKGQPHLRRAEHPLPLPADETLANRLLAGLRDRRHHGTYPASVRELLAHVSPEAPEKLVKAALTHGAFAAHAVVAAPGDLDAPAMLAEDRDRLAAEPKLLEYALNRIRTPDNQAAMIADLSKCLAPDLRADFAASLGAMLATAALPETVGCLVLKKKPYLFLKSELAPRPILIAPAVTEEPEEQAPLRESFEAEMSHLEQGREAREEETEEAEQGDLFATANEEDA